eukprot:118185-Chlamydomonas_euryale.AAC.2
MSRNTSAAPACTAAPRRLDARRGGSSCIRRMLSPIRHPGRKALWWGPTTDANVGPSRVPNTLVSRQYSVLSNVMGRYAEQLSRSPPGFGRLTTTPSMNPSGPGQHARLRRRGVPAG